MRARVQVRRLVRQDVEQDGRPHDEHAGVPAVPAGVRVEAGGRGVGLLHELRGPARGGRVRQAQQLPRLDVAVGRRGIRGRHPDRHDVAGLGGGRNRVPDDGQELRRVRDRVVGGEGADDGVRIRPVDEHRRQADRGGGVLGRGLRDQPVRPHVRQLLPHRVDVRLTGHHPRVRGVGQPLRPLPRRLQERAPRAQDVVEELGAGHPGHGPQASARAAGGDDCMEGRGHADILSDARANSGIAPPYLDTRL